MNCVSWIESQPCPHPQNLKLCVQLNILVVNKEPSSEFSFTAHWQNNNIELKGIYKQVIKLSYFHRLAIWAQLTFEVPNFNFLDEIN